MRNLYQAIGKDAQKLTQLDMKDMLNLDTNEFKKISNEITNIVKQIGSVKIDTNAFTKAFADIRNVTKNSKISGENGLLSQIIGHINTGQIAAAKKELQELQNYANKVAPREIASGKRAPGTLSPEKYQQLTAAINSMNGAVAQAEATMNPLIEKENQLQKELEETKQKAAQGIAKEFKGYNQASGEVEKLTDSLKRMHQEEFSFNREAQNIDRQIQSYFGLSQMIRKVGDIARDAFATVKELDKAMTQTAVVTNFSVGDMWDMLPTYTQQANQLGSTIRDVYEAATLYYQQGLNTNQAMSLANETLKMARIAGLDAADATNMMTAALRGFNMEINQQSAQKINDIYSELAAITASDTKEIGSAMERTASIANSANMEFATTSAFLAQMIETTREAPENLGTAMKTIVARFQEMKQDPTKLIDSEGVAMDANKVDKALKTIGVNLMNTKGEFRDLDDVFLDISAKWDSLTQGQQRYIATIAAGSRQQSRFIAMMSNYERTMELVDAANNSAGASQRQFEKTLDSMEAKLNKLKNAWDQFTMGLMNNQILKFGVDVLTEGFTIVNKFIDILGKIPPKPFEGITKSILTLVTTLGMLNFGKKASRSLVMGGVSWWQNGKLDKEGNPIDGGFFKGAAEGWGSSSQKAGLTKALATVNTNSIGYKKGQELANGLKRGFKSNNPAKDVEANLQSIKANKPKVVMSAADIEAEYHRVIQAQLGHSPEIANATKQEVSNYIKQIKKGEMTPEQLYNKAPMLGIARESLDPKVKEVTQLSNAFEQLGGKVSIAGSTLMEFGAGLGGPVGGALTTIGSLLMTVGNGLSLFATESVFATAATEALGTASWFSLTGIKALGAGVQALWAKFLASPLAPIIAVMAGIAAVAYGIYRVATADARTLEAASDAAAAASEAYDSAKQETSELADAIEQVKSNEEAFDGLVAGTAAFNEQLVTANDQIMDLIKKYPMLNDYLTTDKNGLMHISNEGLEAVKKYQKQRQANASALNLIQTADLNSEEARQKANQMRKTKGTDTLESLAQRKKEADLLEQQAEAQQQMAKLNAVNAALVDKEIGNREKVSSIMADQYDARRDAINLEGESIHDLKQEYADFYGYTYDKSTKKIKDIEGNEIDVSNDAIKDAVKDIRVIADIEVDASSVEGVLHSLDRDFSKTLGDGFKNSSTFISDILSNNAETNEDLLEQVLDNPEQLNDFVEGLSTKEIAAVLGVSEKAVEDNIDNYKQQLEDKLLTNARNIIDTNAQANGELAAMLAQAQGKTTSDVLNSKEIQNNLMQQVKDFTSEQRNTLLNIGKTLETSVGSEAMTTFINGLSDIYQTGNEELITTAQNWADGVNWDSAIGRLEGYNEAINMTADDTNHLGEESVKQINNLGQALLDSRDEANLLGEAFTEFYNSTDFQDMAENMDKFVDSSGQLNAASIMDMAEECGSLNNLLDTGAISAGGVAAALNALGSDGDLVLSDLNSKVLELLSNFGQLDGIIASSHRNIENFDWGIDTGESADFVKESAEKWNELYNNGEVGNPQLEAYAKYVLGEEKYIALLAKHSGDLQATMDDVSKYVNEYSEGFDKAWSSLADGGWEKKVPKELQDLNISFGYDENGNWEWDPGSATTEQLSEWLQAVKGIGPEMAAAMIEDWQNYSPNFRAERQKNDFQAGLDSYIEQRKGANGEIAITASELQTIASSTGQDIEEVQAAIAERAGIEENQIKVLENIDENTGEYVTDGAVLNKELSQTLGANGQNGWLAKYQATDSTGNLMKNTIDIGDAIAGAIERGYTQAQATSMAYESYTNAEQQGKDYYYKGELIEAGQYKSLDDFAARLAEIDQNEQWVTIGQTMADAWIARIDAHENGQTEEPNQPETPTTQSNIPKGTTVPGVGYVTADGKTPRDLTWQDRVPGWVTKLVEIYNNPPEPKSEPTELTPAQYQKMYGGSNYSVTEDKSVESNNNLQEAATKLQEGSTQIETAATKLETGATKVESAASKLETAASNLSKPEGLNSKNSTIPNGSTVPGVGFVPSNSQSVNGNISIETSEADAKVTALQTKLKELNDLVSQGNTYKLNVSGAKDIKAAASAAKTLTKNTGTQTIKVKTGKADTSSVDAAKKTISNTESKIKVGATVDSAIAAARRAQRTINGMSATIDVEAHVKKTGINSISIAGKTYTVNTAASGQHNHGYAAVPSFGSAARGRYGQVGPKGKGGLTLTGELGYEVAWLPDENRSMILGANGPQMIDLPGNAVVWDHEQSKKIIKQKAIPAGSHSTSTRPGNTTGGGGGGGGGGGSTPKGSQTPSSYHREITKILTKGGKVSVWWENIARMAETRERAAAKTQKKFDKLLQTFGTTATKAEKVADTYRADLQKVINVNKKQVNKANGELRYLDKKGKASISYQVTKKKGSKKTTETKKETVNIGKFIKQMEDGTYIIDQKAITKIAKKNKAKAEAIKQAIEQRLNDKISKRNKALDEIEKAQDKLAEISNNIYDTFYRWEFSLNKIYFLAQKLSSLTGQMDYRQSREELVSNRVLAGYGPATATDQISQLLNVLEEEKKLMIDQVEANIANAEATKEAYLNSINFKSYVERYEKAPDAEHAAEDIKAAKWALRLIEEGGNFDESQIEKLKNQGYNEYTINQIKEILDDIDQKRKDALQASTDANASINTIYNKIVEYESYISDFEADLLTGIEEQTEKEINRLDKLNSSLSKAYKDLLDEVKRALDERRKREDNAKTERDIAQKQQRLAALRADTSGGHQVEIAQLEKEIAEAQQNYQRTLEDQLLENLQNQGDKAEKQRQQQIELLSAQKEIAQQTGTNLLQVQEWLKDPEKNKEQIRAAWLANRGYDDMTERQKTSAEHEFEEAWMKYGAYLTEVADLREVASNTKFESIDSSVKLGQIAGDVEKIANQVIDTKATGGIGWSSFKAAGGTAEQARELGALASSVQSVWGTKETFNAGYTKKALTEAGITVKDLHQVGIKAGALNKRGYKATELKDYYSIKELAEAGYSYSELRKIYKDSQIKKALNANLAKKIGVPDKTIAKWYGSKAALKAGAGGAAVQAAKGTGLQTQQKIVNESKKDKATQSSLAGISTKLDTNGKKKGGKISATVNASGKSVTGNKGSTLYTRKIDTKTGKLTGDVTTTKIADLSTADFTKNKKEATDALIYAIKHREVGSKISSKMKSLVSAAGIAGKTYKLKNNVTASVGANGKIYYATKDAVKIWDASAGKVDVDKYNKNEYLKKAQKNNSVSREYAQALINRNAFTKPQLQKKGVKKFATGGLASYTGPAWLDGTPSRPELVLNAKDTQNFIALKDVLANAMSGMGDTSNTYGDVLYEININVDKIEKDYDVDRVVKKVKEEITKGAGYRNVTQVRNFR